MSEQSNAVPGATSEMPAAAPAAAATAKPTRPLYWSVRRELWENRSIFIAPLAVSGVLLFGSLISPVFYHDKIKEVMLPILAMEPAEQAAALAKPYDMAAIALILTSLLVAVFYCLDALYGERRDRSILFWKSLPVSDITTVLSKALIPLLVLPLIVFVIILATQFMMLLISTFALVSHGLNASVLWTRPAWFEGSLVLLYGLAVNALWYAPIYGWLLLVSSWARRSTLLWAVLTPLAACLTEAIAFRSSHFASLLKYRIAGGFDQAFIVKGEHGFANIGLAELDPLKFLSSPGVWSGLIVAAGLCAAAVRMRRSREPI